MHVGIFEIVKHGIALMIVLGAVSGLAANWQPLPEGVLNTRFGIQTPGLNPSVKADKNFASKVEIASNSHSNNQVSFGYGVFGFTLGTANPLPEQDKKLKGDSRYSDFQVRFLGSRVGVELFYQTYLGYYLTKRNADNSFTIRDDISTQHYGFNFFYLFDREAYSINAAFAQADRQTVNGGSWVGIIAGDRNIIAGSRPLVPTELAEQYGDISKFKAGDFLSVTAGMGYGYTWTHENFYLTELISLNFGQQHQMFALEKKYDRWIPASKSSLRIGFGYNGTKNFGGFQFLADSNVIPIEKGEVAMSAMEALLFYGRRFDCELPILDKLGDLIF
jgi:hypothetical protein